MKVPLDSRLKNVLKIVRNTPSSRRCFHCRFDVKCCEG